MMVLVSVSAETRAVEAMSGIEAPFFNNAVLYVCAIYVYWSSVVPSES